MNKCRTMPLMLLMVALACSVVACQATPRSGDDATCCAGDVAGEKLRGWVRSELYFGMNRIDGSPISDEQWAQFVDAQITPRFPSGLTVFAATGQYRDTRGVIQRERSRVLVVLYPVADARKADGDLRAIAQAYNVQFQQETVLRIDAPAGVMFLDADNAGD